jgi:hypothetical protein
MTKIEMLKQTPIGGIPRKVGDIVDIGEKEGGDATIQRWITRGIAKISTVTEVIPQVETPEATTKGGKK